MQNKNDEYTKHVEQNTDVSNMWSDVPQCNRLSLDEDNQAFEDEFKKVIDDDNVPHADTAYDPEMFDSCIGMEVDIRVYEVEYLDGTVEAISANIIAKTLLSQVDEEGNR